MGFSFDALNCREPCHLAGWVPPRWNRDDAVRVHRVYHLISRARITRCQRIDTEKEEGMADAQGTVCLTFDFDAISIWIGPHASKSPSMISRGEFGAVGVERILRLLDREQIPATFFIPGHTVETYPDHVRAIITAG